MFDLIDTRTLILKMVERKAFLMKPKHQCHLSKWGECVYIAQSWKEKILLSESVFIQFDKWNLILKIDRSEVFLMKSKHQCHLSQKGGCVYGANH